MNLLIPAYCLCMSSLVASCCVFQVYIGIKLAVSCVYIMSLCVCLLDMPFAKGCSDSVTLPLMRPVSDFFYPKMDYIISFFTYRRNIGCCCCIATIPIAVMVITIFETTSV
jgi:hypothetical protein